MKPELFGQRLSKVLRTLQMSQSELAQRSGLTQAAISQILSGKREPSLSSICAILQSVPVKFELLVRSK